MIVGEKRSVFAKICALVDPTNKLKCMRLNSEEIDAKETEKDNRKYDLKSN